MANLFSFVNPTMQGLPAQQQPMMDPGSIDPGKASFYNNNTPQLAASAALGKALQQYGQPTTPPNPNAGYQPGAVTSQPLSDATYQPQQMSMNGSMGDSQPGMAIPQTLPQDPSWWARNFGS